MYIASLNHITSKERMKDEGIHRVTRKEDGSTIIHMNDRDKFKSALGKRELFINYYRDNDSYNELSFNINRHGYTFNVKIIVYEEDIKYIMEEI